MLVPDLCALVCDFAHDSTLLKLSMCNKFLQSMLTSDHHATYHLKGYNLRLHKHRYNVASTKLERLHRRLQSGQLVDLAKLADLVHSSKQPKESDSAVRAMADYKKHYFMSTKRIGVQPMIQLQ